MNCLCVQQRGAQGEQPSLSRTVFACFSLCEGPPSGYRTEVLQPPMHSPIDAPLFSINVLTMLIRRLGGFHFDSIRPDVEHICEINFCGVNSYEPKAFMFILGQTSQG